MLDQTLDAPEGGGAMKELQFASNFERPRATALDVERQHVAEALRHLASSDGVPFVRGKTRVADARDGGCSLQPLCELERALTRPFDAKKERAHASKEQPCLERAQHGPSLASM